MGRKGCVLLEGFDLLGWAQKRYGHNATVYCFRKDAMSWYWEVPVEELAGALAALAPAVAAPKKEPAAASKKKPAVPPKKKTKKAAPVTASKKKAMKAA